MSALQFVPCDLCGRDRPEIIHRISTISDSRQQEWYIVRCGFCGARYLNPQPRKFSPPTQQAEAFKRNWIPEFSPHDYVLVRSMSCLPLIQPAHGLIWQQPEKSDSRIPPLPVSPKLLRAAFLGNLFTYVPSPRSLLSSVTRSMKHGGYLFLSLAHAASFEAHICGSQWRWFDPPNGRNFFTPATIRVLLHSSGYENIKIAFRSPTWNDGIDPTNKITGLRNIVFQSSFRRCAIICRRGSWMDISARYCAGRIKTV